MEIAMLIRTIVLIVIVGFSCLAQTPVPTSFSFPVPVSFTADYHNFDMVANELGMHIVYPSSSSIHAR